YWELEAYREVPDMLATLKSEGFVTAILSNGAPEMLSGAVESAGIAQHLDAVLSVESVGIFKPDARVYDLVGQTFDLDRTSVLFVSSNGWDVAAAAGYGFRTVWVNRRGEPVDRLPWIPERTLPDLSDIPALARP
ncbi:MAG: HAD-IA family hydrolase, partial [Pseudomonadota bacterium]